VKMQQQQLMHALWEIGKINPSKMESILNSYEIYIKSTWIQYKMQQVTGANAKVAAATAAAWIMHLGHKAKSIHLKWNQSEIHMKST
jgi:hypothetical protein